MKSNGCSSTGYDPYNYVGRYVLALASRAPLTVRPSGQRLIVPYDFLPIPPVRGSSPREVLRRFMVSRKSHAAI
jgi:hypothetical protein